VADCCKDGYKPADSIKCLDCMRVLLVSQRGLCFIKLAV
jgi:hypothetical protein